MVGGVFLKSRHPAVGGHLGDAELPGVVDLREHDLRGGPPLPETLHEVGDAVEDDVVAQIHHEVVVPEEVAGYLHGMGQTERLPLPQIGDLQAEPRAVADGGLDLGTGVAHHDAGLRHPRGGDRFQTVEQHRLVAHRHELFGQRVGDRPQPGS